MKLGRTKNNGFEFEMEVLYQEWYSQDMKFENTQQTPQETSAVYWSDPRVVQNYTEAAKKDDKTLDILVELVKNEPEVFSVPENGSIVELGSGTGITLKTIAPAIPISARIFGTDLSSAMLAENQIRDRYETLLQHDLANGLPPLFREKIFNAAFAFGVFQFLSAEALERVMKELGTSMSPESPFIFSIGSSGMEKIVRRQSSPLLNAAGERIGISVAQLGPPMYYYTDAYIRDLLKRNGFKVVNLQNYFLSKSVKTDKTNQPSLFIVARKILGCL